MVRRKHTIWGSPNIAFECPMWNPRACAHIPSDGFSLARHHPQLAPPTPLGHWWTMGPRVTCVVRRQDGGLMDRDEGLAPCIYDMGKEYEPLRCDVWTRITTEHVREAPQSSNI